MHPWTHFTAPADYLKDRVIVVTGAGQGLGEATALACARAGATVVLLGRSERKLTRVYDAIVEIGGPTPAAIPVDFAKMTDQDCVNLANLVWKEFDRVDGIVHCANGFNFLSPLIHQKLEEWVDMFKANVAVPFAMTRALLPLLKRAPDASVVFVGEEHAFDPKAYWGGYAVTRAGQHALSQIAGDEWDGIPTLRVNEFIPGRYRSPFRVKTHPAEDLSALAQPAELAPALLWLLGPASSGTTRQVLRWSKDV
ncbi:SDR family NAD(P)-dependent oxidoreductase [Burkholderiaceae bacterium DAT-1]|nr:SDR family NAD(P)-dependent oxidoreductase [Burkholderiaceae bacterium DAT-1]